MKDAKFQKKSNGSNNRGKGQRPRGKSKFPKNYDDNRKPMKDEIRKENDPQWYRFNDTIYEDASKLNYFNQLGARVNNLRLPWKQAEGNADIFFPSLMSLEFVPTIGLNPGTYRDPVNIQMRAIYSNLQSRVSTKLPFAPSDIAMYFGGLLSVYIMYSFCQRVVGVYNTYMTMNVNVPYAYYRAFHLPGNPDTSSEQGTFSMAAFKTRLNRLGYDLGRFYIPKDLKIFLRQSWLCSNIFADNPDPKAQQYVFVPWGINRYSSTGQEYGGSLTLEKLPDFEDLGDLIRYVEGLFEDVLSDKDVNEINSYILRGYGEGGCFKPGIIPEDYKVEPAFVPEVLLQIHNATIIGTPILYSADSYHGCIITQNSKDLVTSRWRASIKTFGAGAIGGNQMYADDVSTHRALIDMPMDHPTPDDNYIATRLSTYGRVYSEQSSDEVFRINEHGTEWVATATVYVSPNDVFTINYTGFGVYASESTDSAYISVDFITNISRFMQFNMHPILYLTNDSPQGATAGDRTLGWVGVLSELSNYTVVSASDINRMHHAATMGEWYIPTDFITSAK